MINKGNKNCIFVKVDFNVTVNKNLYLTTVDCSKDAFNKSYK
jgi:hypothetical protein